MFNREKVLFNGNTEYDHYQVIDMVYEGRKARVLFSGDKSAAFSGIPLDGEHKLLFDYIQRFFELVSYVRPSNLLIIGGGVYTLPTALINSLPDINIKVIERDDGLDALAERFFGFKRNKRLSINHCDGKEFLANSTEKYDMVILDAFTDLSIPKSLAGYTAAQLIYQRLNDKGIVAINIISSYKGRGAHVIENFFKLYTDTFKNVTLYPADGEVSTYISQNFILIGQKDIQLPTYGLKYQAFDPFAS
jgi:spermidine synthase